MHSGKALKRSEMKTSRTSAIWVLLFPILLASCNSGKMLTSAVSPQNIQQITLLNPQGYVGVVDHGNKVEFNDSLSYLCASMTAATLQHDEQKFRIANTLSVNDTAINRKINAEIADMLYNLSQKTRLDKQPIPPVLDSVLHSEKIDYALAVAVTGFERREGNYNGQVAKSATLGVLTFGMFMSVPVKSNIEVYTAIIDEEHGNIAFYRQSTPAEKSPVDPLALNDTFGSLFEGYLY